MAKKLTQKAVKAYADKRKAEQSRPKVCPGCGNSGMIGNKPCAVCRKG